MPPSRRLTLVLLIGVVGCEGKAQDELLFAIRDSAGVQIIENRHNPDVLPSFAVVDSTPMFEIGVATGNPDQEFGAISTAAWLCADRILVVDGQAREFRFFDSAGELLRTTGRTGEGPGEFRSLSAVAVTALDSIRIWDRRNRRITVLGPAGDVSRLVPLEGRRGSQITSALFLADGTVLASASPDGGGVREYRELTLVREPVSLITLSPTGEVAHEVGTFPGDEQIVQNRASPQAQGFIFSSTYVSPPFPRSTYWAVGDREIFVGDNESFKIDVYDQNGDLRRRILCPELDRPLTSDDVEGAKASRLKQTESPESRRLAASLFDDFPVPQLWPAFSELMLDHEGFLWVREYGGSNDWFVFQPTGELAGKVEMPAKSKVYEIGEDYVVLRPPDDLDVPKVRIHRIRRQSGD